MLSPRARCQLDQHGLYVLGECTQSSSSRIEIFFEVCTVRSVGSNQNRPPVRFLDVKSKFGSIHTSPVHQDPLENWLDGTASALGHVPELGRTPE